MTFKTDTTTTAPAAATAAAYDNEREYEMATPLVVDGEALPFPAPTRTLNDKYASLANLRKGVTWEDPFFDDEDFENDIIAVFDFDYVKMESFNTSMNFATLFSTLIYAPIFVLAVIGGAPCYIRKNAEWSSRTQHVAITQDGIRFVHDRRPCCWGLPFTDKGKTSKTVPFDKITDCDIEEPAGNSCLCVPNILTIINVDTASSGGVGEGGQQRHELKLAGLKDPHSFKKLVWAMKRSQQQGIRAPTMNAFMTDRGAVAAGGNNEDVALLLREIRDELRQNNSLLRNQNP